MMAANPFTSSGGNLSGFSMDIMPVTPSDSNDIVAGGAALAIVCKGAAGDVAFVTVAGNTRIYPIDLGEVVPAGITRVLATGTTATGIWAHLT